MRGDSIPNQSDKFMPLSVIFFAIFVLNIIGSLLLVDKHDGSFLTFYAVGCGLIFFLVGLSVGRAIARIWRAKRPYSSFFRHLTISELRACPDLVRRLYFLAFGLFVLSAIISLSLFLQKGIPLLAANDTYARTSFGSGTFGRIRALIAFCPLSSLMMFLFSYYDKRYRRSAYAAIGITLVFLAFYSFKGNIVWYLLMLFLVSMYMSGKKQIGKAALYATVAFLIILSIFSLWLSEGPSFAFENLLMRATADEVDGFDFIIHSFIPLNGYMNGEHFFSELSNTFFSIYQEGESFDFQLASLFYGKSVTWGIVQTLYGFCYLDYGLLGIAIGFFFLGLVTKLVEKGLEKGSNNTPEGLIFGVFVVVILIKILLVGNVFNELKGLGLSALVFYWLYCSAASFIPYRRIAVSGDKGEVDCQALTR